MTAFVRGVLAAAVLCTLLVGCGTGRSPDALHGPSPGLSAEAASPRQGKPFRNTAPRFTPGPAGLTPVFRRAAASAAGKGRTVALTFDADMTADQGRRAAGGERFDNPALIATLRELKVPATVFMTGRWAEEYPDQARAIGGDPLFEIANHSYSHYAFTAPCYGLPVIRKQEMRSDVERAFAAFRAAGVRNVVPYFRFPGGCYDDTALRAIGPAEVTAVQWDVVGGDAFATDSDAVAEQVLSGVRPGSLVVMHCTRSAAPATEQAIRKIVPELRARGYRMVKVSELMRASLLAEDPAGAH
ncbi:polysaccharide deacetylase family protein [Streptomyces sp. NBC_00390]|uniref:polysaccharide deacetylase family protein n=1 Tax=Streptomyces sp. NBC_00390 TaxID=2975736 RepID=UPI002E202978